MNLSPFATLELGLMTGCLWTSGARTAAFCSPVTPFPHNLCMPSLKHGSCVYWEGGDGCSWGMVHRMSAAWGHVPGGCGVQHIQHDLHTLQPLLIEQHNMFCRSLVDVIPFCHS